MVENERFGIRLDWILSCENMKLPARQILDMVLKEHLHATVVLFDGSGAISLLQPSKTTFKDHSLDSDVQMWTPLLPGLGGARKGSLQRKSLRTDA